MDNREYGAHPGPLATLQLLLTKMEWRALGGRGEGATIETDGKGLTEM